MGTVVLKEAQSGSLILASIKVVNDFWSGVPDLSFLERALFLSPPTKIGSPYLHLFCYYSWHDRSEGREGR